MGRGWDLLNQTEDEKKKKTASQQASIQNVTNISNRGSQLMGFTSPLKKEPVTPKITVEKQGGFNLNSLVDTIKKAVISAIPQLAPKTPLPTIPKPTVDLLKINVPVGATAPKQPPIDNKTAVPSAQLVPEAVNQNSLLQNTQVKAKNIIDSSLKFIENTGGKVINKIANAEQSVFGIKLGTIGQNVNDLGQFLSGAITDEQRTAYNKLDNWSKLSEASKAFGALLPMSSLKVPSAIEGAKDVASAVRGLIAGYGAGSVLNYASQEPGKRSIGEAIKPNLDNMIFSYFTGSTGLPNPFELLKKQPEISKASYIEARDFLKNLGVKEEVFSNPEALKKSYFDLVKKYHPDIKGTGNAELFKSINDAYKKVTNTFYDVAKTGDKPIISGLLEEKNVMTPEQAKVQATGTDLNGTPLGNKILETAKEAEAQGKNIKIEITDNKNGALTTPSGTNVKISLVDIQAPIQKLTGEVPIPKTPETVTAPGETKSTELQTVIQNKITEQGGKIADVSVDKEGFTTLLSDKMRISYKENPDTIDIVGFKRGEEGIKGEPTKLLDQIKEYASSQNKTITATKITGTDIEYWKKVGFEPVDVSGGKGIQYEAIWEKQPPVEGGTIPQELQPLAEEAKKYKNPTDAAVGIAILLNKKQTVLDKAGKQRIRDFAINSNESVYNNLLKKQLKIFEEKGLNWNDFYNQATGIKPQPPVEGGVSKTLTPSENIKANQQLNEDIFKQFYKGQQDVEIMKSYGNELMKQIDQKKITVDQALKLFEKKYPKPVYKRGDITKVSKALDEILGTQELNFTGKWQNQLAARATAFEQLEYYANQGIPEAQEALKKAEELDDQLNDLREAKKAPSGIASSGAESIGEFEQRVPKEEVKAHDLKIFEQVQALIKKYAQTVGEGYTPRGALGVYYSDTKNIRINGMNDLSVASHEITHFLDYAYKISEQLRGITGWSENGKPKYDPVTRKFRKEITDLYEKYYPGGKRTHSLKKRTVEGFATLLQKYVEMPKQITEEYPDLVKNFLQPGGQFYHPIMKEIINDLNKFIADYQALPALDKIGARVANGVLKTDKEFLNIFDKIRTFAEDQIYPTEKLDKLAGTQWSGDSVSLWLRAYSNGAGIYANNILNGKRGYWTLNDSGEFIKKYDFNWKNLLDHLKKEKIDNSFGNYLVSRDQYFEWQELDKLKADYQLELAAIQDIPKEELATTIDSNGKSILDKLQEMRKAVKAQNDYLRNNGFTRSEVEEAYNGNKDRFVVEEKMYDKLVRADLDMLHNPEIGLVSDEVYEKLSKKEGYASMKRQMYDDILGNEQDKFVGAKSTKASSLKQRSGGQQQIINPVLNGMTNHIEITKKAMRQAIYNKIGKIAQSAKLPELFQVQKLRVFPDDQGRLIFPQERDPNIIMARLNGKRVPFLVDKYIKKTVDDVLTYQAMNLFENLMVNVSRGFTLGTTGAYAPFALTNVIVDQWSAVMNTRNKYTPILDITKAIGNAILNKDPEVGQYYQEWQILGGDRMTLFQSQMQTMEDAVKYVTEETNKLEKVKLLLDKGIDILSIPAKYSETMSRFTEYYKARKAGKNQLVALEEAGRVTAPFHHIGSWKIGDMPSAKYMVRSVPFGNAALQAMSQTIRTGQTPEGRKRIMFLIAALIAGYLSSLWAVSQLGSKDQKEQYKDLTPTDIATYLHFPAIGGNGLIRVKVSQELSTLGAIMIMVASDNILKTKYNATDYKDALTNWIPRQINIFSPIEMFFSWLPPLVKIPIELLANFKDYPRVKPMENQGMLNKEPGQRFNEATSPLAKAIGEKFNISPIKTDFLIEGFLGRASRLVTGKKGSMDLASGVYRDYFFSMGRRVQDFYDESTAVNQRWNTLKTKYKGKTGLSSEVKSEISSVNKKRLMYGRINDMLGELRKINIKAEPYKATYYRTKIIEGFEQIDKMK